MPASVAKKKAPPKAGVPKAEKQQMPLDEVMSKLESMGTAQNRKVYRRHGATEPLFGVSFANLGILKKALKTDQQLAEQLWQTENSDARYLATMIADPEQMTAKKLDEWAGSADQYGLADSLGKLAAQTKDAEKLASKWTKSKEEWVGRAGFQLVALLALERGKTPGLTDDFYEQLIPRIEDRIHQSKNRIKDAMLNALIAIGLRSPGFEKKVLAASKRIGAVEVDHGETGCKTPEVGEYIARTKARQGKG